MGSVGVQTGGGKITKDQAVSLHKSILQKEDDRGALGKLFAEANSVVIFPDSYTSSEAIKDSVKKWSQRLGLGSVSRGFALAMTGATVAEKKNIAAALVKAYNLPQNSDERYEARANALYQDALKWARANGRTSLTSIERRAIQEIARSTYQREQIDKFLNKDRARGGSLYGTIKTRNLYKSDFKKHEKSK